MSTPPSEFKNLDTLDGVALEGVTELRLIDCAPACLRTLPPHVESVYATLRKPTTGAVSIEIALPEGGALTKLEVHPPYQHGLRWTRLPASLKRLQVGGHLDEIGPFPPALTELSLWSFSADKPLHIDGASIEGLTLNPLDATRRTLRLASLPENLSRLWAFHAPAQPLPSKVPPLRELWFDSSDLTGLSWSSLPPSLEEFSACRCVVREPVDFAHLPRLKRARFYMGNLTDIRALLAHPTLEHLGVEGNPLSEESVKAIAARPRRALEVETSRKQDIELTRRFYALGVNLSAVYNGRKKIEVHYPMAAVVTSFLRERVLRELDAIAAGGAKLVGEAFIKKLNDEVWAEKARIRAEKKAARKAARQANAT